jgi:hypothetical protein
MRFPVVKGIEQYWCSGMCRPSSRVSGPASPGPALDLATHPPLHRAAGAYTFNVLDVLRGRRL